MEYRRLPLTSSNGYTTPAPSRLSRFRWRLFLVGGPCIFLCVLFLVLRGGSQRTSNSKGSPEETYTLSVNSTCLNNSGEWIEVGINTLEPLEPDAMVALFSPPSALVESNLHDYKPIKWAYVYSEQDKQSMEEGQGLNMQYRPPSLHFKLLNMRDQEGYAVALFSGAMKTNPVLLAKAKDTIQFKRPSTEILHLHLALTGKADEMRISWVSGAAQKPEVKWWTNTENRVFKTRDVEYHTYKELDMCGVHHHSFHDPGYQYSVVLENLIPGKEYHYMINEEKEGSFTHPSIGKNNAVRVVIFGDMGASDSDGSENGGVEDTHASLNTMAFLMDLKTSQKATNFSHDQNLSLVLHIGDLSYALGRDVLWDVFSAEIEPVARDVPYMTAIGNHERLALNTSNMRPQPTFYMANDSAGECGVPYSFRFRMPFPSNNPLEDTSWYSFNHGPIHFTVMSTEHSYSSGSEQYKFIVQDLVSVNRFETPWLVFTGHRPIYVDSPMESDFEQRKLAHDMNVKLEELLMENKVDLAIWGHHHIYQRTCPIYKSSCVSPTGSNGTSTDYAAPIHIITGASGASLHHDLIVPLDPIFEYINNREYGIVLLEANETALLLSYYSTETGKNLDEISLRRESKQNIAPESRDE